MDSPLPGLRVMSGIGQLGGHSCCNFGMVGLDRLEYNDSDGDYVKGSSDDDDILTLGRCASVG